MLPGRDRGLLHPFDQVFGQWNVAAVDSQGQPPLIHAGNLLGQVHVRRRCISTKRAEGCRSREQWRPQANSQHQSPQTVSHKDGSSFTTKTRRH